MEVNTQPKLSFHGVDIVNVTFEAKAPRGRQMDVEIECEPTVFLNKKKRDTFSIVMEVTVSNENYFLLSLRAIGKFKLSEDITEDIKAKFLTANAPAIMFPYIRSFITTFTANLGNVVGTLTIPPQFFKGDIPIIIPDE
ncbi:hypothetical protein FH717_06215 [Bacteroides thetaiotaomicron]|jgi:preprotein translocase subunit SecB|uniref:protein-export chaperone SecB n=1 Tax=Bacteroides thetaiotaomicron TaxID=818 RepID=UPI001927BED2|nr:protein-export chaperone SecB [Bacteroides thetaiotaomicron]MBL3922918.1 hypothetical protein [Bacteroides thetaiotaomicron]MBL3937103.1 hypothetical protein [Bacteroides thetaiotaomicron]